MTRLNSKQRIYVQVLSSHVWMWNIFFWETNLNKIIEKKTVPKHILDLVFVSQTSPQMAVWNNFVFWTLVFPRNGLWASWFGNDLGGALWSWKFWATETSETPKHPWGHQQQLLCFFVTKSTSWWLLIPVLFGFLVLTIWKYMIMVLRHENAKSVVQTFPLMDQLF